MTLADGTTWHTEPTFDNGPIETNDQGGKQSKLLTRFDLLDWPAMICLANVLDYGARKYTPDNWRRIDVDSHLNHLMNHIARWKITGDHHELCHAFCRAMMALAVALRRSPDIADIMIPLETYNPETGECGQFMEGAMKV